MSNMIKPKYDHKPIDIIKKRTTPALTILLNVVFSFVPVGIHQPENNIYFSNSVKVKCPDDHQSCFSP